MNYSEQIAMTCPWLRQGDWEKQDRHLRAAAASGIEYRHLSDNLSFAPGSISILRGPRQIGKSTECKLIIRSLLRSAGVGPHQCIYFPCDNIVDRRELLTIVETAARMRADADGIQFLFLDEITSVKEWYKTVKWLKDAGGLERTAVVVTGSSAWEMRRGYERMPGRRSGGLDMVILPMDFPQYARIFSGPDISGFTLSDVTGSPEGFSAFMDSCLPHETILRECAESFMTTGGVPLSVSERRRKTSLSRETLEIYHSLIASEFEKQRRSTATLKALLRGLQSSLSTPTSYNRLASTQNIHSPVTVKDYLELLQASFILFPALPLDISKKAPFPRKDRKYYFTDISYAEAVRQAFAEEPMPMALRAECAVACKLVRPLAAGWAKWGTVGDLYCWRSESGREVDFVVLLGGKPFGIEVKYQSQVSGWDDLSITRGIGRGAMVTKTHFEYGIVSRIPLWAFLLLEIR